MIQTLQITCYPEAKSIYLHIPSMKRVLCVDKPCTVTKSGEACVHHTKQMKVCVSHLTLRKCLTQNLHIILVKASQKKTTK